MAFRIVPMQESDLDDVMRIEQACFRQPWKRLFFSDDLKRPTSCLLVVKTSSMFQVSSSEFQVPNRQPATGQAHPPSDEAERGRLVGYAVIWRVEDEVHLANIAVDLEYRRRGIADELLRHIFVACRDAGCRTIYLEVRVGNTAARELYRKHGFKYC